MKRSNQLCGALCFAASSLVALTGWARDTAGPDIPRRTRAPSTSLNHAAPPKPPVAATPAPQPSAPPAAQPPVAPPPPAQPSAPPAAQPPVVPPPAAPASAPATAQPPVVPPPAAQPSAPAAGQPSAPARVTPTAPVAAAGDAELAKQYYERGAEAFAAHENADAIRYFGLAAQIVPSSKLRYNIALAYDEMGDTGRALAEYRAYLRQEAGAEQLEDVQGRVRELEARLAVLGVQQLSVLSSPPGATVRVDDHAVGITPWSGELVPGRHRVTLELAKHEERSVDVELPATRATELRFDLPEQPAPPAEKRTPSGWGRVSPLTWSFLGVGAGAISGGIAFELSRAESSERAGRASSSADAAEARGSADAKQMASLTLLGFGSAFLIGGGILMAIDLGDDTPADADPGEQRSDTARIGLPCVPGFCGVTAQGRF